MTDYELGRRDGYKGWRSSGSPKHSADYDRGYEDGTTEWWFDYNNLPSQYLAPYLEY